MAGVTFAAETASTGLGARLLAFLPRAAGGALAVRGLGIVAGFLFQLLMARALGADGYGVVALALCLQAAAMVLGRVGLDTIVMQVGGPLQAAGRRAPLAGLYRRAALTAIVASAVVAAVLAISAEFLATRVFNEPALTALLPWLALSVVPGSLAWVQAGMLKTLERPAQAYWVESALLPLAMCLVLVGVAPGLAADPEGLARLYLVATCVAALIGARLVDRCLPRSAARKAASLPRFGADCVAVTGIDVLNFMIAWSATVIVAAAANSTETSLFSVANRLVLQIGTVLIVLGNVYAPRFAALHEQGNRHQLENLARRVSRTMIGISALPVVGMLLAPGLLLSVFGEEFVVAESTLRLLTLGQLVNALTGPGGYLLVMAGRARQLRAVLLATLVLTVPGAWLLAGSFGASGAALAIAVGVVTNNLVINLLVVRHLDIQPIPFLPSRQAVAVPVQSQSVQQGISS